MILINHKYVIIYVPVNDNKSKVIKGYVLKIREIFTSMKQLQVLVL